MGRSARFEPRRWHSQLDIYFYLCARIAVSRARSLSLGIYAEN